MPCACLIAAIAIAERTPLLADHVDFDRLREVEPRLALLPH
jgi:predicted nucleic acid-binding protein